MAVKPPTTPTPWQAQVSDVFVGHQSVTTKDAQGRVIAVPGSQAQLTQLNNAIDTAVRTNVFNKLLNQLEKTTGKTEFHIEIRYISNEVKFFQVSDSGALTELYDSKMAEESDAKEVLSTAAIVDTCAQSYIKSTASKRTDSDYSSDVDTSSLPSDAKMPSQIPSSRATETDKNTDPQQKPLLTDIKSSKYSSDNKPKTLSSDAQYNTNSGDARLHNYHHMGMTGQGLNPRVQLSDKKNGMGIKNDSLYCYANSATQMLRHIPSLRAAVTDKLTKAQKAPLITGKKGADIVRNTRALMGGKPADRLPSSRGHDASEFFGVYLNINSHDATSHMNTPMQLTREYIAIDDSRAPLTRKDDPLLSSAILLPMSSGTGKHASFYQCLHEALNETTTGDNDLFTPSDAPRQSFRQTKRTFRFTEPVKQIFIKPQRFGSDGVKDQRAITDIAYVLDLQKQGAMADGVTDAKPLELKGFTVHIGSGLNAAGGHYVSYFQKQGKWHYANDDDVYEVTNLDDVKYASMYAADLYYDDDLSDHGRAEMTRLASGGSQS
ncbi:hypothetical protein COB11_03730 [Candidatus Aerophobetes bacterium]|uniref:USP domain-containing protein n=1 Tax=Aerophobetes bacterium TaxID=2030807 RepID=A0A2A4YIK2_UNCAE|nr:MAG: hypothetical protein COB11_03730 [Candidatus Aerophobetes bacterium]